LRNIPVSSLKASGIPPHLAIAVKVKVIGEKLDALENRMINTLKAQATEVVGVIRQHLVIEGAVPVSMGVDNHTIHHDNHTIQKWYSQLSWKLNQYSAVPITVLALHHSVSVAILLALHHSASVAMLLA